MQPIELKEGIYWVGAIDWELRNFHGYLTPRGSTYNAYLIIDEKITLIDTVKHHLYEEMIARIAQIIDPAQINYLVSSHVEMDHSGGIPRLAEVAKNITIVTSSRGETGLKNHYGQKWSFQVVKSGEVLPIGKRSLKFIHTPMVHWPDNMVGYLSAEKILFTSDAFGQHLASAERFDDELPRDIVMEEAKRYYANIVLPHSSQVIKAMQAVSGLEVELIAPSHGLIWRSRIPEIMAAYREWAANRTTETAVIVWDSMWGSTAKIARALQTAFENKGIRARMLPLGVNHISDVMTEVLTARYICVGSPTLNNGMLPTVSSFLTYLKGLAPKERVGLAFGSYGWGGQSISQVEEVLRSCGFELLDKIKVQYVPDQNTLQKITDNLQAKLP